MDRPGETGQARIRADSAASWTLWDNSCAEKWFQGSMCLLCKAPNTYGLLLQKLSLVTKDASRYNRIISKETGGPYPWLCRFAKGGAVNDPMENLPAGEI